MIVVFPVKMTQISSCWPGVHVCTETLSQLRILQSIAWELLARLVGVRGGSLTSF